jgi:hypothetical protein
LRIKRQIVDGEFEEPGTEIIEPGSVIGISDSFGAKREKESGVDKRSGKLCRVKGLGNYMLIACRPTASHSLDVLGQFLYSNILITGLTTFWVQFSNFELFFPLDLK